MSSKTNHYLEQQRINVVGRTVPEFWNLNEELAKADYKIKTEPVHLHSCPYCGNLNRRRRYMSKKEFTKCEECEKIFYNTDRKAKRR